MSKLNPNALRRWRRLLLLRDCTTMLVAGKKVRMAKCILCNSNYPVWRMQAHHIYPKSLYPSDAFLLSNGIMLCQSCHIGIVHSGNPYKDIDEFRHWAMFVGIFDKHNSNIEIRTFNMNNQHKVISA